MQLLANKKFLFSLLGLLLLAGGTAAGVFLVKRSQEFREKAAPATTLRISPPSQSKSPGDNFDFSVQVNTGGSGEQNSVTGITLDLSFNPGVFEVTNVQRGAFIQGLDQSVTAPTAPLRDRIDNENGRIIATAFTLNTNNAVRGEGEVFVITGSVRENAAAGQYSFEFGSDTKIAGVSENVNLLTDRSSGSIIVLGATAPVPSPSAQPGGGDIIASPRPSASPAQTAPSPSASPAGGSPVSASPSPSASPRASASPAASPAASSAPGSSGTGGTGSTGGSAGGGSTAVTKPTISLPANKTVAAGATITGTAFANSTVTITIQSNPITATVKANSTGKWSYTLPTSLSAGAHTITVTDSKGTTTDTFTISASKGTVPAGETPVAGFGLPTYLAIGAGFLLLIFGTLLAL